jgi:hypothetical protein
MRGRTGGQLGGHVRMCPPTCGYRTDRTPLYRCPSTVRHRMDTAPHVFRAQQGVHLELAAPRDLTRPASRPEQARPGGQLLLFHTTRGGKFGFRAPSWDRRGDICLATSRFSPNMPFGHSGLTRRTWTGTYAAQIHGSACRGVLAGATDTTAAAPKAACVA